MPRHRVPSHRHGDGPVHYAGETDGVLLEIYPASAPDAAGLGFTVPDLEAACGRFDREWFAPGDVTVRPGGVTFVVRDPDGRRVEVQAE